MYPYIVEFLAAYLAGLATTTQCFLFLYQLELDRSRRSERLREGAETGHKRPGAGESPLPRCSNCEGGVEW